MPERDPVGEGRLRRAREGGRRSVDEAWSTMRVVRAEGMEAAYNGHEAAREFALARLRARRSRP